MRRTLILFAFLTVNALHLPSYAMDKEETPGGCSRTGTTGFFSALNQYAFGWYEWATTKTSATPDKRQPLQVMIPTPSSSATETKTAEEEVPVVPTPCMPPLATAEKHHNTRNTWAEERMKQARNAADTTPATEGTGINTARTEEEIHRDWVHATQPQYAWKLEDR